jgi:hypothetical protein
MGDFPVILVKFLFLTGEKSTSVKDDLVLCSAENCNDVFDICIIFLIYPSHLLGWGKVTWHGVNMVSWSGSSIDLWHLVIGWISSGGGVVG